jgi:methylenetetrahydrofolate dehydrogenase (NADP+)/methenyltetrahydrofolate cyclohydrolase
VTEAAVIIGGVKAADELIAQLAKDVARFTRASGITPGLALVALDEDPVQRLYVRKKLVQCERAGIRAVQLSIAASATTERVLELVQRVNADQAVHGIFVQWPLPDRVDLDAVARTIASFKDIDGMGSTSYVPAAALACHQLLRSVLPAMSGYQALIARGSDAATGDVFAKAIARILLDEKCSVTLATRGTDELPGLCRRADVLIAALSEPEFIRGDWIKPGAVVIDVGINVVAGYHGSRRYVGDVQFEEAVRVARAITPVPGGVGPMTIACLLQNTLEAAKRQSPEEQLSHG